MGPGRLRERIDSLRTRAPEDSFAGSLLSLGSDSFQYLVGLALIGLANMILVPLYTRYLSPEEFGVYGLIEIAVLASIAVSSLGFNVSYVKWFAETESARIPCLLGTQLWVGTAASGAVGFAFVALLYSDSATRFLGGSAGGYAWAVMLLIVLESVQGFLLNHLRAARNPRGFSGSSVIRLVAIAVATIWLMAYENSGLPGLFWGRAIGDAIGVLVLLMFCRSALSWRGSREYALGMLRFGFPLVFGALIMMVLDGSGRFFLNHYSTLREVGIFSIGSKIAGLMRLLLVMPFGVAWGGMMFQIAGKPNARIVYSKLVGYLFVLSVAIALVLSLVTPALFAVFATPAYVDAIPVVPLLLLVQAITVLQYPIAVGIYLSHETKKLAPIFMAGLICNVLVSWLLVPRFGTSGAAIAWLAGWSVILLLTGLAGQKKYPLDYELKPFAIGGVLVVITVMVPRLELLHFSWWWLVVQMGASLAIILLVGLFLLHDIRTMQRRFKEA